MLQITVTGKISQFKKLHAAPTDRFQGLAVLKEYARDERVGYERFWLLWLPKHAMAYAEIQKGKGFTVAVIANGIAVNQGMGLEYAPDAGLCLSVSGIEAV